MERGISRGLKPAAVELRAGSLAARQRAVLRDDAPTEDEMQTNLLPSDGVPLLRVSALGVTWIL